MRTYPSMLRRMVAASLVLSLAAAQTRAADLPPADVVQMSAGRLHPLLVHFPIALLVVAGTVEFTRWVFRRKEPSPLVFGCLVFGALGAAAAAGSGWLYALHEHPGRSVEELVEWHRWTGVVTASAALLCIPVALARRQAEGGFVVFAYRFLFTVAVVGAGGAGHLGGDLMYGEGFVTEPLADHYGWVAEDEPAPRVPVEPVTTPVDDEPAAAEVVHTSPEFTADILPLFEARCFECHGERKQKGKLRLDAAEFVWGDDPARWEIVPGDSAASSVYERISLPADDIDIMPPEGQPLSAEEIALVKAWIDGGARWDGAEVPAVAAPVVPEPGSGGGGGGGAARVDLRGLPDRSTVAPARTASELAALTESLQALRARGARAMASSAADHTVEVDLSLAADVSDADLALLAPTAPALVWLNLARTAITDAGARQLAGLSRLETLRLDGTSLGDAALASLHDLQRLQTLNLVGTSVSDDGLVALHDLAGLRRVFLCGSAVTPEGAARLRAARPDLHVDLGAGLLAAVDAARAEEGSAGFDAAGSDG